MVSCRALVATVAAGRDVRPAAQSLSFAQPKESNPRKGCPHCLRPPLALREPAVLAASGVPLELACGLYV